MTDRQVHRDDGTEERRAAPGFWRSRAGIGLLVAFSVGGLLLGYEHRVHLFAGNWTLLLLLLACLGVHAFMHGGHGSPGGPGPGR